ncbi:MAG: DsbA family protein [Actinobacteria bacterium]|nr:DsbA family protein [Actinomycetota bacterium]
MADFAVTWDYRCPFARNAHEHLLTALEDGAGWDVSFVPFSLGQAHVAEGDAPIWERPGDDTGLLALQAGVYVRDRHPDRFYAVHRALFAARHDRGGKLNDRLVVGRVLRDQGLDAEAILTEIDAGAVLSQVRDEHEAAVDGHEVWGVPTFIRGDEAVFVRVMDRPGDDRAKARRTIERIIDLLDGFPELNEFKHTSLKR